MASFRNDAGIFKVSSSNSSSEKVNVSIYYEALCLRCAKFIVNKLENVFENGLISIINLRLVPWGDSYISKSNDTIICKVDYANFAAYICKAYQGNAPPRSCKSLPPNIK
ncbi:Gamma interferon inducible lysosomal thiol reductase GILT [Corchorus olitorius]|uniref:Gamma interferon inducible lysosomal thiol reductase GILT n=1 Tax=Corchorus olitorius TaxID=93759 RepID=A0A1R3JS31_9ROSI|nr:Gamma interferon inducible lysosomal thiol reductase GILT [Corchorus olitorius]